MHQPPAESLFRRGSFGVESGINAAPTTEAAQQFQELLNRPDRPAPSRRASLRAMPATFVPAPPLPTPVDGTRLSSQSKSMRSPSPTNDLPSYSMNNARKAQRSPVRPPPSLSSAPRRNSSQAEHFMRSNSGLSPPPSASKRAYSFAREQTRRPSVIGQPAPPPRTNSCPPEADVFTTRMMRSNSDGYTSTSTSFLTEDSSSPTSSDSSQPSDSEEGLLHIKRKAPEHYNPAELEMESRRLELVWRETEKQWVDKHGTTLPRSQEMAFRRNVEGGYGVKDDSAQDKEWREMWKNTNSCWAEFEAHWRKEEPQRRPTPRNDEGQMHSSKGYADDDKVMNTIFSYFEKEMEKRRQRTERKRQDDAEKSKREERPTHEREPDSRRSSGQAEWAERLRDTMRTRSSSVAVDPRPSFHRSRSGSVATIVDPIDNPGVKRTHSTRMSRDSLGSVDGDDEAQRVQEKLRADELKRHSLEAARRQHYASPPSEGRPQAKSHLPVHRESTEGTESGVAREDTRHHRESSGSFNLDPKELRPAPSPSTSTQEIPQSTPNTSIREEVLRLEREQALLARRIQELRAVAEAAEAGKAQPEPDRERGREKDKAKDKDQKKATADPRPKSQARKHKDSEGDAFKAINERLRKGEDHRVPERSTEFTRKAKPSLNDLDLSGVGARPATAADGEPAGGRVHFASLKPSVEDMRSPTPPRVRTPNPRASTPARVRTPSPRSESPVGVPPLPSSAARDSPSAHEATPSIHEPAPPEVPPKIQTSSATQPALRPAGRSREAGLNSAHPDRPKSGTVPMPTLNVPHLNTFPSPVDSIHDQAASPMGAKTPRATSFDPDRTPRAQAGPVPESNEKADPPLSAAPRVYISPNQARARAEGVRVENIRPDEDTNKRRMDPPLGASLSAAAAETFDRAGTKKRTEMRTHEDRRAGEEHLARERRAEEERRLREEQRMREERLREERLREEQRAEEARRREAADRRDREERARYDREREQRERDRQEEERRRRWAAEPSYERASRQPPRETSIIDAWHSYELRWSALSVASSNQPITFRDIPWPLLRVPTGPESITPQAVGAFILSPLHSQDKPRRDRLRTAMLRWHSDKFEGRWMARIDEDERPKVKEAVGAVARALTELMTHPDLY